MKSPCSTRSSWGSVLVPLILSIIISNTEAAPQTNKIQSEISSADSLNFPILTEHQNAQPSGPEPDKELEPVIADKDKDLTSGKNDADAAGSGEGGGVPVDGNEKSEDPSGLSRNQSPFLKPDKVELVILQPPQIPYLFPYLFPGSHFPGVTISSPQPLTIATLNNLPQQLLFLPSLLTKPSFNHIIKPLPPSGPQPKMDDAPIGVSTPLGPEDIAQVAGGSNAQFLLQGLLSLSHNKAWELMDTDDKEALTKPLKEFTLPLKPSNTEVRRRSPEEAEVVITLKKESEDDLITPQLISYLEHSLKSAQDQDKELLWGEEEGTNKKNNSSSSSKPFGIQKGEEQQQANSKNRRPLIAMILNPWASLPTIKWPDFSALAQKVLKGNPEE